jgi:hypothetical protein
MTNVRGMELAFLFSQRSHRKKIQRMHLPRLAWI